MSVAKKPTDESKQRSDSSSERVFGLLDLFTVDKPVWTVDTLLEQKDLARATIYRYVKALVGAGFLAPVGGGGYGLGPRFVEMDRQIRIADPLLRVAPMVMSKLRDQVAGSQLLCSYYGLRVLCVLQDRTDPRITSSFERGRPLSLFRGAPSRVILANLPTHQLQRIFLHDAPEIAASGLGENWIGFRDKLKAVRAIGYAATSEIDKTLLGVAAPIFFAPGAVSASLCLVRLRKEVNDKDIALLAKLAMEACETISAHLQNGKTHQSKEIGTKHNQARKSKRASID